MSMRFGRNQKRAFREALKERGEALTRTNLALSVARSDLLALRSQLTQAQRQLQMMQTQIRAANEVLGPTIALPPIDEVVSPAEFKQIAEMERLRMTDIPWSTDYKFMRDPVTEYPGYQTVRARTMDLIEGGIELLGRDHFARRPHAYVRTVQGDVMYRVALEDLAQISRPEGINRVATMLATEFIDHIKRVYGARIR